jgi:hypothetical protein
VSLTAKAQFLLVKNAESVEDNILAEAFEFNKELASNPDKLRTAI